MKVTVLTRPGCHLCEEAAGKLRRYLAGRGEEVPAIEVEELDIESDDRLHREFLERIPVIMIGAEIVSEFEFEPDAFEDALRRRPQGGGRGRVR